MDNDPASVQPFALPRGKGSFRDTPLAGSKPGKRRGMLWSWQTEAVEEGDSGQRKFIKVISINI